MVFHPSGNGDLPAIDTSGITRHTPIRTSLASLPREAASNCLEIERDNFLWLGCSVEVTDTLLAFGEQSTSRVYNTTWKAFIRWSRRKGINALKPKIKSVLSFLQDSHADSLKASSLRHQVAALIMGLPHFQGLSLSRHPPYTLFSQGAALKDRPQLHRFPTWKSHAVLSGLTRQPFEPIKEIIFKWLKMKTLFLIAVTSARRVSELGALSVKPELGIY